MENEIKKEEIKNCSEEVINMENLYIFKKMYNNKHPESRLKELGNLISRIGKIIEKNDDVEEDDMKKLLASLSVFSLIYSIFSKNVNSKKGIEMFDELIDYIEPVLEKYN